MKKRAKTSLPESRKTFKQNTEVSLEEEKPVESQKKLEVKEVEIDYFVKTCIQSFSYRTESMVPFLTLDEKMINAALLQYPDEPKMKLLSNFLKFEDFIGYEIPEKTGMEILYIRQLFAYSYNFKENYETNKAACLQMLTSLVTKIKNVYESFDDLKILSVGALSYALYQVTQNLNGDNTDVIEFIDLINTCIYFYNNFRLPKESHSHFMIFFLQIFFSFRINTNFQSNNIESTLKSLIDTTSSLLSTDVILFNFTKLTLHICDLLGSECNSELKIKLYKFISILIKKEKNIVDMITDPQGTGQIALFLKSILETKGPKFVKKNFGKRPITEFNTDSFEIKVTLLDQKLRTLYTTKPTIGKYGSEEIDPQIIELANATLSLYSSNLKKSFQLLTLVLESQTYGSGEFGEIFLENICMNPKFLANALETKVLTLFANIAYMFKSKSMRTLSTQIFLFYASNGSGKLFSFLYESYEQAARLLELDTRMFLSFTQTILTMPQLYAECFNQINGPQRLAALLIEMQEVWEEKYSQKIQRTRGFLIHTIDLLYGIEVFHDILVRSTDFLNAVCQLTYEKKIWDVMFHMITYDISNLKHTEKCFQIYMGFFKKILLTDQQEFGAIILPTIHLLLKKNTEETMWSLLKTGIIPVFFKFIERYPQCTSVVLGIFDAMMQLPDKLNEFVIDSHNFDGLIELMKNNQDVLQNAINSKKFSASLCSILFQIYDDDKLIEHTKNIIEYAKDESKCIMLTQTDIQSHIINKISYYLDNPVDDLYPLLVQLFFDLSKKSLRNADLCTLMKLLHPKKDFRPYPIINLLEGLKNVLDIDSTKPNAFIETDGNETRLVEVTRSNPISQFTVILDIFIKEKGGVIFEITDAKGAYVAFTYTNNQLTFVASRDIEETADLFNTEINLNEWYKLVITYHNNKMSLTVNSGTTEYINCIPFTFDEKAMTILCNGLKANLGSYTFISEAMTPEEINAYMKLPFTKTAFHPTEAGQYSEESKAIFNKRLSQNLVFRFIGSLTSGERVVNMGKIPIRIRFHGRIVNLAVIKNSLVSVNGISCILGLFNQIDIAFETKDGNKHNEIDSSILPLLLDILIEAVSGNTENQNLLNNIRGFDILADTLTTIRRAHITSDVLHKLGTLYKSFDVKECRDEMIRSIFFNTKLWIYLSMDLQVTYHKIILECFEKSNKVHFVNVMPVYQILEKIRTAFWIDRYGKGNCLYEEPLKVLDEIYERPNKESIQQLQSIFFDFAERFQKHNFGQRDASAISLYSLILNDLPLTVSFLKYLNKNLNEVPSNTFDVYYPILFLENEDARIEIFKLFAKFSNSEFYFKFSQKEWISGIISTMNTTNTTTKSANTILGLMQMKPACAFTFMDLYLAVIASLSDPDAIKCSEFISKLLKDPKNKNAFSAKIRPIIGYIVTQISRHGSKVDSSIENLFNSVIDYYIATNTFNEFPICIYYLSKRLNTDLSFITKYFFSQILDKISADKSLLQDSDIFQQIFEYMFIFSDVYQHSKGEINNEKFYSSIPEFTFSKVYNALISEMSESEPILLNYASRTSIDGTWTDADLALKLVDTTINTVGNFSKGDCLKILSFVVGFGLSHVKYFESFTKHLKYISDIILTTDSSRGFANYFSGIIKAYMQTNSDHMSHRLLLEQCSKFKETIQRDLKFKMNWGKSVEHFDECFKASDYNFAHVILEKFTKNESSIISRIKQIQKTYLTVLMRWDQSNSLLNKGSKIITVQNGNNVIKKSTLLIEAKLKAVADETRFFEFQGRKSTIELIRNLTDENGIWDENRQKHLKLSGRMSKSLMNNMMEENLEFNDHKDASVLRDNSPVPTENESVLESNARKIEEPTEQRRIMTDFIFKIPARMITVSEAADCQLTLRENRLYFNDDEKSTSIALSSITHIFKRVYLFVDSAFEIFTVDGFSYYFEVVSGQRNMVIEKLNEMIQLIPNNSLKFVEEGNESLKQFLGKKTSKWANGNLSNFEYLMWVNICAGRSYNDISAYPVFPWILADYDSPILDLDKRSTFRDLGLPVGTMGWQRLNELRSHMSMPLEKDRYMYGSMYSSPFTVATFLMRVEPFTSIHIAIQGGKFDLVSRQFNSIPAAFASVCSMMMDYRELTPEFFCLPEFLTNNNGFDLGGEDDVALPKWASSPQDFIAKHRAALECQHVSANLPKWIDLIFGVASRGQGAVDAMNVFSPEFDSPIDAATSVQREFAACFGQMARQIFDKNHPMKVVHPSLDPIPSNTIKLSEGGIKRITKTSKSFIILRNDLIVETINRESGVKTQKRILTTTAPNTSAAIYKNNIVLGLPYDSAIYIFVGQKVKAIRRPQSGSITCLAASKRYVASGSTDCTVALIDIADESKMPRILANQGSAVCAIAISECLGVIIVCGRNGLVTVSLLSDLSTVGAFHVEGTPTFVDATRRGYIVVLSKTAGGSQITVLRHNARLFSKIEISEVSSIAVLPSEVVSVVTPNGIAMYSLPMLEQIRSIVVDGDAIYGLLGSKENFGVVKNNVLRLFTL